MSHGNGTVASKGRTHTRITTDADRIVKRLAKKHRMTNAEVLDRIVAEFDMWPAREQREVLEREKT